MIPSILVTDRKKEVKHYVSELSKKYTIPTFFIFSYDPEVSSITIDQIREIHRFVVNAPFNKIVIINQFNTAKKEAQNAFLKTLEEHCDNTHFVLVCSTAYGLLPTIESRCHVVRFQADFLEVTHKSKSERENILMLRSIEEALDASCGIKKEAYIDVVDSAIMMSHASIIDEITKGAYESSKLIRNARFLRSALSTKALMLDYNVQPEYTFDQLLIHYYST